jgi:trehalose utilization protein
MKEFLAVEPLQKYENQGYVFKRCQSFFNPYDCILVLQKPKENFQCNEERLNIKDKNYAKFRCNGLIAVAIYDLTSNIFRPSLTHRPFSHEVIYSLGKLTTPDFYDNNVNRVCSFGIHYFLSLSAAVNYIGGNCIGYDENGEKKHCL